MNHTLEAKSDTGVVIEQASLHDLGALRRLEQICFPKDAWPLLDLVSVLTFRGVIRLKAVVGSQMVGFIAGDVKRTEGVAWVATVGVLPEYRGRGIGALLMQACEAQVPVSKIRLCVRPSNDVAIRLYERLGYTTVGEWTKYYQDGESASVMEKVKSV